MSIRSTHRAILRDQKRSAKLSTIIPQLTAKVHVRLASKTSKHRGQKIS